MNGSSLASDLLWVIFVPPVMTAFWWLLSQGWTTLLGTSKSQRVRKWIQAGLWIILVAGYVTSFSLLAYKYLLMGR
jgi:hypothetical protein